MMYSRPRLLLLTMLPVLGVALHRVHDAIQSWLYLWTKASAHGLAAMAVLASAFLVGPALTAAVFVYPLSRLYTRQVLPALVVVSVPLLLFAGGIDDMFDAMDFGQRLWLCLLVAIGAWIFRLRMGRSILVIGAADAQAGTPDPLRWLKLSLLPLFAMATYYIDLGFDILVRDPINAVVPDTTPVRQVGWVLASLVSAGLATLVLAYPIARVFERRAVLVAVTIAAPSVIAWVLSAFRQLPRYPWTAFTYATKAMAIGALLALAVAYLRRRMVGTRLVVIEEEQKESATLPAR